MPMEGVGTVEENGQQYTVEKVIGRGGMCTVYSGHRLWDGLPVAVKRLDKITPRHMAIIEKEIRLLRYFNTISPDLFIHVYDAFYGPYAWAESMDDAYELNPDQTLYVVLEKGVCLCDLVLYRLITPEPERSFYFIQMASAIAVMHENAMVHGDIKSENFVLTRHGNLKIIDLGNSTEMPPMAPEIIRKVPGTRKYMPPEKKANPPVHGYSADIYSLGVILYRMAFGHFPRGPLKSETKSAILIALSGDKSLVSLLAKMLHEQSYLRPTIQEVLSSRYVTENSRTS